MQIIKDDGKLVSYLKSNLEINIVFEDGKEMKIFYSIN